MYIQKKDCQYSFHYQYYFCVEDLFVNNTTFDHVYLTRLRVSLLSCPSTGKNTTSQSVILDTMQLSPKVNENLTDFAFEGRPFSDLQSFQKLVSQFRL